MHRARTVSALNLRLGDTVILGQGPRGRVIRHRLEGAQPVVVIHYEGFPGTSVAYPPSTQLLIEEVN